MADLPHFLRIRSEPGKRAAWVMAVAVHALLALFLIYGIRWQTSAPEAVSVDLVRDRPSTATDKPALPPQEQKPPEPVPKKVQKEEPPAPPKAEILRKESGKPKPIENAKRVFDTASAWINNAIDRRVDSHIADAASREQAHLKASQDVAVKSFARAAWGAKIAVKIKGNIVRPPNVAGNPEAIYEITLLPDGSLVGEPSMKKSTGNHMLDDAIVRAILKSSPLPKPDDPNSFERVLTLTFRPMED